MQLGPLLGQLPREQIYIKGPYEHSEPMAQALQTSSTGDLWATPSTKANKTPAEAESVLTLNGSAVNSLSK